MTEMMEQLKPIAEILGPLSVKADYSQIQIAEHDRTGGTRYRPGWKVDVKGAYEGASVTITKKAPTLDEAASEALKELKEALGLP
jgi:hypothetical protein